jgi:pyruvate dehydrogenase E1 component beta subunit
MQNKRYLKYNEAILEATDQLLTQDEKNFVIGLGVNDPKAIFGTTLGLKKKYSEKRIMDMPASENAMTGVVIGCAIMGLRPIMVHQRSDFFLLAMDQLINNAAKWYGMFGGQMSVPVVFRLIIGKGWGQGPQHSQALYGMFAQIPGIKIVMPSTPYDAKGLLIAAVKDKNPVIYIEHRWLHNIFGEVPKEMYDIEIGKAKVVKEGKDITIIAISDGVLEAIKSLDILSKEKIDAEIIDIRTIKPLDKKTILNSIKKTKRVLIVDSDWKMCSVSSEILAIISEEFLNILKALPRRLNWPEIGCPTSWSLSNHFYYNYKDIAVEVMKIMGLDKKSKILFDENIKIKNIKPQDIPDSTFKGPF